MELKATILGLAIYTAMALYAAAASLFAAKVRRAAWILYGAGFAAAAAGWGYRWVEAGHVPLQNLFDMAGMNLPEVLNVQKKEAEEQSAPNSSPKGETASVKPEIVT